MANNIDNEKEEYASDLKKKIEEAKLKKRSQEDNVFLDVDNDESSMDELREMKSEFENGNVEDEHLETVEFDSLPQNTELEKTKVISSNQEPLNDLEEEIEDLSDKEKKNNKILIGVIVGVLVVVGIIGAFALNGGSGPKDNPVADTDKDKDKEDDKDKDDDKDEVDNSDSNEKEIASLQGQIDSNLKNIETLKSEINTLDGEIDNLNYLAQQYATDSVALDTLKVQTSGLEKEDMELPENAQKLVDINTQLSGMGCQAGDSVADTLVKIESCKTSKDTTAKDMNTQVGQKQEAIRTKEASITEYENQNVNLQKQLDALKN